MPCICYTLLFFGHFPENAAWGGLLNAKGAPRPPLWHYPRWDVLLLF